MCTSSVLPFSVVASILLLAALMFALFSCSVPLKQLSISRSNGLSCCCPSPFIGAVAKNLTSVAFFFPASFFLILLLSFFIARISPASALTMRCADIGLAAPVCPTKNPLSPSISLRKIVGDSAKISSSGKVNLQHNHEKYEKRDLPSCTGLNMWISWNSLLPSGSFLI